MKPRPIARGEVAVGLDTKYPMMTAKPIMPQLMGRTIEIEAWRFNVSPLGDGSSNLLAECCLGHPIIDDLAPAFDDGNDTFFAHAHDLPHRIPEVAQALLCPFIQGEDDELSRFGRKVPPLIHPQIGPEPEPVLDYIAPAPKVPVDHEFRPRVPYSCLG